MTGREDRIALTAPEMKKTDAGELHASEGDVVWKQALCGICPAGCWVEVGMHGDRLVDIRADSGHPLGMICKRGRHAPEIVYSEHRLSQPMRRKGEKGTYEFEPISWDDAYDLIVERLNAIKAESGPEAVAIYTGRGAFELSLCDFFQPEGVSVSSASSVLFPFGSPNTMGVGALCYVSYAMIAPHVSMGRMLVNMFTDIENAETLFVWGTNPATDSPPLDMFRLEQAARRGAEIYVIDPRRTETVERTGATWIPIRPGTDGALALSMIETLIEEELFDEEFAEIWCHGFDELRQYAQHFTPEVAAEVTGVPSETIRHLARRVGGADGACPVMYTGLEYSDSGIQAIRAVHALFALAGQLDAPGGIGLAMNGSFFPINRSGNLPNPNVDRAVARDRFPVYTAFRGESHASGLVDAVLKGDPYPIRALIVHGGSILTSWPQTPIWRETLKHLDFLVTIDRQLTADAAWADVVLPATTMFEIDSYMSYGPIFRLREKVIEPVGEAKNDYLIMAELARRLGYGHLFPQTEEAMIRQALEGSGFTPEEIREKGGWVKIDSPVMEYRKWEKGLLRADGRPGFETPTGKFELWSTTLEEYGYEPLPKYTEPREGPLANPLLAKDFPLVFNSGARNQSDFRSQHHGVRGLVKDYPEPTVDLHPEDASDRGIADGDLAEVRTPRGAVTFRTRVTPDIVKGSVECSQGGGTPVGTEAWKEWNVNELTDLGNYDEVSGFPVYKALLCEVVKLADGDGDKASVGDHTGAAGSPDASADDEDSHRRGFSTGIFVEARPAVSRRRIYLDNNATTRMADEVREAMLPFLSDEHGNPSSLYLQGREARDAVEDARRKVASIIGTTPRRILFTGSGSEADNLALKGIAAAAVAEAGAATSPGKARGRIITSRIEHPAILNTADFLERTGYHVDWLDVDRDGLVDPDQLRDLLTDETLLVSVMLANNEVGTIQPIAELCMIAHEGGALFHTDAVQGVGKIPVDVEELGVDMLSLSAHKLHGPKGIGALYVRKGIRIEPLIHGGKQEGGLRAGTHNVPAIVGFGRAAELVPETLRAVAGIADLRDRLEAGVREAIPGVKLNGYADLRLPNTLNFTLPGIRGESLVVALDRYGVSCSSGSACKAGNPEPTHVLLAMGRTEEEAHCSVRFSLSRETTEEDVEEAVTALGEVLDELENTIRFLPCK